MSVPVPAVELAGVTYTYPATKAGVTDISLRIATGDTYALLGANGAGKTTLMRLMVSLLKPAAGSIRYFGSNLQTNRSRALAVVGSLIETPSVYEHLTAQDHLQVFCHYNGIGAQRIEAVLSAVDLTQYAKRRVKHFSLGMKQRLGIATALLHDPKVLILDEPTNGLDPEGIVEVRNLLRKLASNDGKTVIISSHLLSEVEKIANRIAIIAKGHLRFEGTVLELASAAAGRRAADATASLEDDVIALMKDRTDAA